MGRTFALAEFARLAAAVDPTSLEGSTLADRIGLVAGQRGRVPPAVGDGDDIVDPYRQELDVARACAARIDAAVGVLCDVLAGP